MNIVDLRSDTVTKPTLEMRQAMFDADVGDDVYGEDPTVNALEMLAAERMGKEAGVFVSSGTMGNLVSGLTHCQRGDEVLLGTKSHILMYEVASLAAFGGVQTRSVPNDASGMLDPNEVDDKKCRRCQRDHGTVGLGQLRRDSDYQFRLDREASGEATDGAARVDAGVAAVFPVYSEGAATTTEDGLPAL